MQRCSRGQKGSFCLEIADRMKISSPVGFFIKMLDKQYYMAYNIEKKIILYRKPRDKARDKEWSDGI